MFDAQADSTILAGTARAWEGSLGSRPSVAHPIDLEKIRHYLIFERLMQEGKGVYRVQYAMPDWS